MQALLDAWKAAADEVSRRHRKLMSAVARKQALEARVAAAAAQAGRGSFQAGGNGGGGTFVVGEEVVRGPVTQALLRAALAEALPSDAAAQARVLERVLARRPARRRPLVVYRAGEGKQSRGA